MAEQTTAPINRPYGEVSLRSAGDKRGIRQLVSAFYRVMDTLPEAKRIRDMHPENLELTQDKLSRFLCGWLGGPKLYREKYGLIQISKAHQYLDISIADRDGRLKCMVLALDERPYDEDFKQYQLEKLFRPAERSRARE